MNGLTTITTKGQVTIPEAVRQMLRIKIGDKVAFNQVFPSRKQAVIEIIPATVVDSLFGSLETKVKESNYKKAREKAGKLLLKKYKIR